MSTETLGHDAKMDLHGDDDPEGDANFEAAFAAESAHTHALSATSYSTPTEESKPAPAAPIVDPEAAARAEREKAEADAAAAAQAEADRVAAEANAPVTITRAELTAMQTAMARVVDLDARMQQQGQALDKANGRVGSINQALDELRKQASTGRAMPKIDLEVMRGEMPELAGLLEQDFARIFGDGTPAAAAPGSTTGAPAQGQPDNGTPAEPQQAAAPVNPLEHPDVVARERLMHEVVIDRLHPGWRGAVVNGVRQPGLIDTPEFKQWMGGLHPVAQNLLGSTNDSTVLDEALTDFKKWDAQRIEQAAAAAAAAGKRTARVANAVAPTRGAGAIRTTQSDDDAFSAGFNGARG